MIKSILVISALVLAKFVTAEEITDVSELTARLDDAVPKILDKHKAPGVAIALVNGNGLVGFRSYGFADVATKTQITQRTMFNVGSISKLVTAWGAMQLVAQDKVDLDVLMDIPVTLQLEIGRAKVSIRNLLSYTQGSVVEMDRLAGEPLDLLVNGTLIAHGEVVVINDKFGVRLTDVVSPQERIKKLK